MSYPSQRTPFLALCIIAGLLSGSAFASNETGDNNANLLLQLAADTELANAQTQAANAKLEAKQAKQKLMAPKQGQNAIERTTQGTAQLRATTPHRSPIDSIALKSLVKTGGETTAWIALDGELIEVKKGSKVGTLSVIDLNENSILFSDGQQTKRKWMAGFKTPAPQPASPRGR